MRYFDYIYYRVYETYQKWKEPDPWIYASMLVVILQFLNLLLLFLVIEELFNLSANLKPFIIVLMIALIGLNFQRYHKVTIFEKLKVIWKDEQKETKINKGWYIVLYIILSLLIPIAYGIIRHNIIEGKSFLG
jgi:hypothetical protein